jgi:2'-hydroxyisoflavone reductase
MPAGQDARPSKPENAMTLSRRQALKLSGSAALAAALAVPTFARANGKKVLILGGTGFIGPHFVKALMDGGHTVTLFNRGKRDPEAHPGVEQLLGDRDGQLDALKGRSWDAVIDNSGYFPRTVRLSAELLKPRVKQYIFISSIAAYADFATPNIDENYRLAKLDGPVVEEFTGKTYGPLKVLCEEVVNEVYGNHATIIRPTYIAGPGDYTDRFTYWPFRVAQGGEMLAPGTPDSLIAYIDVRDLADFIRRCTERQVAGTYNIVNKPGASTIGGLIDASKRVTGGNPTVTWAPVDFLRAQGLIATELARNPQLPIWDPPTGAMMGIGLVRCDRALKKGLKFRPMDQTVRDTMAWQKSRPPADQVLKAGIKPEREAELLKLLKS